jgi:hypothetical protein
MKDFRMDFASTAWLSQEQVLSLPDGTELVEGAYNSVMVLNEAIRWNIDTVFDDAHGRIRLNHDL